MKYVALAAATMTAIIGGGLWLYNATEVPDKPPVEKKIEKPVEIHGVGIIDMERIQAAHPDGEQLNYLLATEMRLRLELNEAMKVVEMPKPSPPETNQEVFDEAAWQKNAQIVVSQLAELESRKKLAAEEYRKKSEPHYLAERDKISEGFMNQQLNIQLKLQNHDNLRLTDEQVKELQTQLENVQIERNNKQRELLEQWMAEIKQHAEESVAADEKKLRAEAERLKAQVEEQTRKKESDVTERNKRLMENAVREMENRQIRRQELFNELQAVSKERSQLEKEILNSIVDKATMLAAINRLEMVFVKRKPALNEKFSLYRQARTFDFKPPERVGAVVFPGKDSRDLTDDLIKEMNRQ